MSASEKKAKNGHVGSLLPNIASLTTYRKESVVRLEEMQCCNDVQYDLFLTGVSKKYIMNIYVTYKEIATLC